MRGGEIRCVDYYKNIVELFVVYAFIIAGFLAFFFIFYGGLSFILSGGNVDINKLPFSVFKKI